MAISQFGLNPFMPERTQVSATRGQYAAKVRTIRTGMTAFSNETPMDRPGADPATRVLLLIDILDPCSLVGVTEVPHA